MTVAWIARHVRHPMCSALLLYGLGQVLVVPNWVAGVPFTLSRWGCCLQFVSGPEEKLMRDQFNGEYEAYASRTKSLISGIW